MKKHTIKSIALGLALAGYATSSAWALVGTSASPIQGQKPVLKALTTGKKDHTVTLTTLKADGTPHKKEDPLSVGDAIILSYVLTDSDGDAEGEKDSTVGSVQFYHRKSVNDAWIPFPASAVARTPAGQANTKSEIKFTIPQEALGSTLVGYKLLEKTQFGFPAGDKWYKVPDAFDTTIEDLGKGVDTDPGDNVGKPGDEDVGGGGDVGTEVTPPNCDPTDPACEDIGGPGIKPGNGTEVRIFAVGTDGVVDTANDYAKDATLFPVVKGLYSAAVYTDGKADDMAKYTKYQWKLVGNNAEAVKPAPGQDAGNHAIAGATLQMYAVGINTDFAQFTAGAQGFNLQVEVNP